MICYICGKTADTLYPVSEKVKDGRAGQGVEVIEYVCKECRDRERIE